MHVVCVRAHTAFSCILMAHMECQSQEEFTRCISALPRDEHKWDGGRCDFHPMRVCTCEQCENKAEIKCVGVPYQTKMKLSCPFHALASEIERDSGHNFRRPSYSLHLTHVLYYTNTSTCISQRVAPLYIGMARVGQHRSHTFRKSTFPW